MELTGKLSVNAVTGEVTNTAPFNYENPSERDVIINVLASDSLFTALTTVHLSVQVPPAEIVSRGEG